MSAKHTPGPWKPWFYVQNKRLGIGHWAFAKPNAHPIPLGDCKESNEEAAANARLIAAAPDLLEALERCERRIEEWVRLKGPKIHPSEFQRAEAGLEDASANARAAIAKARGDK